MRIAGLIPTLFLGIAACGVAEGGNRSEPVERPTDTLSAGRPAPSLLGVDLDGGRFDLGAQRGDVIVLVFYRGPFCGICQQRLRSQEDHRSDYDALGARTVAVVHGPTSSWNELADELDVDVPIVAVDRATLERWGVWPRDDVAPRPAAFVLDESGRVRYHHIGATAADRVGDFVLLAATRRARAYTAPNEAR